jgi:hypothetical protein
MYRDKRFRVRKLDELRAEIDLVRKHIDSERENVGGVRKVFLADGDALMAKSSYLAAVLDELRSAFGPLARVSCYASPQSLQVRSVDEMRELRERGLSLYYLGIESGHDEVLQRLVKGVDSAEMVRVATMRSAPVPLPTPRTLCNCSPNRLTSSPPAIVSTPLAAGPPLDPVGYHSSTTGTVTAEVFSNARSVL